MISNDSKSIQLINLIIDKSIQGVPPLIPSEDLAREYINDKSYKTNSERISSLINWEMSKNFSTGFVTNLGGLLTLPISVPAALGASWIIQARMAGAIAVIYEHNLKDDRVRTLVTLSILGDSAKEVLKQAGIKVGEKLTQKLISQIPGKVLIEINKKVGFRLLTKAGEKGIINLMKIVPVAGGIIGGTIDASACIAVGKIANELFER